jgi:hypothetical protein
MTPLLRELLAPEADARCMTALVMYFYRHPHIYVTTERLAAHLGYPVDRVESSIEALTRAGVIVQRRHPGLGAVMCRVTAPPWPPGLPATTFMSRWQRQIGFLRSARERSRRAALRAADADQKLRRVEQLMASLNATASLPHDG